MKSISTRTSWFIPFFIGLPVQLVPRCPPPQALDSAGRLSSWMPCGCLSDGLLGVGLTPPVFAWPSHPVPLPCSFLVFRGFHLTHYRFFFFFGGGSEGSPVWTPRFGPKGSNWIRWNHTSRILVDSLPSTSVKLTVLRLEKGAAHSIYLSIDPCIHPSIRPSIRPFVRPSIYASIHPYIHAFTHYIATHYNTLCYITLH